MGYNNSEIKKRSNQRNMKPFILIISSLLLGSMLFFTSCKKEIPTGKLTDNLIPLPVKVTSGASFFYFKKETTILTEGENNDLKEIGKYLSEQLQPATGWDFPVQTKTEQDEGNYILLTLKTDKGLGAEGYDLTIDDEKITLSANEPAGLIRGIQSIIQLLPAAIRASEIQANQWKIQTGAVYDYPTYAHRGAMLDVSRHFFGVDEVKRYIDFLAAYKMNILHLHLADDQGWRIEIKSFPNLTTHGGSTEVGGGKGGFFTQEDYKEIVKYAAQRYITIIPEIDMPGHCFSFVAAYPECGCLEHPQETDRLLTYPADAQRFPSIKGTDVLCVGKPKTVKMCKDILDELMEIFPSKYIHIGGDEVNKKFWKGCKHCQAHKKAKGLKDEHELQSWFIKQLDAHITSKGRRMVGWDEILEGGLAKNATVMSWQGEQGGIKSAKMGHDVVMSPQTYIYLDHGQSHSPLEPAHWPGHKPLDRAYSYNPIPKQLSAKEAKHILGVQGNVWTVFIHEEWLLDLCTWPRAAAIAEVGWTPQADRNWDDFYQRISSHREVMDNLGINYWWEQAHDLGNWTPKMLKPDEKRVALSYDISKQLKGFKGGDFPVTFTYTGGPMGLSILEVSILENGKVLATKAHEGFTGVKHENNTYKLKLPATKPNATYTLKAKVYGNGGQESNGKVHVSAVETKKIK